MCVIVVFFDDLRTAQAILDEREPRRQKFLARNVINFDEGKWNEVSQSVVEKGSLEKVNYMPHIY